MRYTTLDTPLGRLLLVGDGEAIRWIDLPNARRPAVIAADWRSAPDAFVEARRQFGAYFSGTLRQFDLPLDPRGTPFQRRVWSELARIPYAQTISYAELARRIGNPNASRAVGLANGRNPLSIIVPCHRVIGANGSLTGYGGGLAAKEYLLAHERRHVDRTLAPLGV